MPLSGFRLTKKFRAVRLSISISEILSDWVREEAKKRETTVSQVIGEAIFEKRQTQISEEMIRGLIEDREDEERRFEKIRPIEDADIEQHLGRPATEEERQRYAEIQKERRDSGSLKPPRYDGPRPFRRTGF